MYFELNGTVVTNNSEVSNSGIGEGESALLCKTMNEDCCGNEPNRSGDFYYPNRVKVSVEKFNHRFYRNRGDQVVRLNHNRNTEESVQTGRYSCEIPDACGVNQTLFVTIS